MLLDPQKKEYYQKKARKLKLPNPYTAAIADYMRTPRVKQVNAYGDTITYSVVKKDFSLRKVDVMVRRPSGAPEVRIISYDVPVFRLHHDDIRAGVVVRITDSAGRETECDVSALAA